MIEDLARRVALSIAALLLLATGLATVAPLAPGAQEAAASLARHLARQLDAISRTDGTLVALGGWTSLPPELGTRPYRVEFRRSDVRVVSAAAVGVAGLQLPIHPAPPPAGELSDAELEARADGVLVVPGGETFVVTRLAPSRDGRPAYVTFVHLPH